MHHRFQLFCMSISSRGARCRSTGFASRQGGIQASRLVVDALTTRLSLSPRYLARCTARHSCMRLLCQSAFSLKATNGYESSKVMLRIICPSERAKHLETARLPGEVAVPAVHRRPRGGSIRDWNVAACRAHRAP